MSTSANRHRRLTPAAKIIITLLLAAALICLSLSGYYAYRVFFVKSDTQYVKENKENGARGEAKMDGSSSLNNAAVLGKTADAGREYIEETLFLGDSNTVRFMTFLDEDGNTFTTSQNTIAVVGMGAEGITSTPCMETSWGTYTMAGAVEILQPRRIILTFGTNNLDIYNMSADLFIENYEAQIEAVENAYPYADLIINSIPPCRKITHYPIISIEQIREYNDAILKMCEAHEWKYLNSFEALSNSMNGYARDVYFEDDGIHLNDEGLKAMFRYIRTHALISEDRRPKPLADMPYIYGPVTEIFAVDPLSNEPFDESVLHPEGSYETVIPVETPADVPEVTEEPLPEEPLPEETAVPEEPPADDPAEADPPAAVTPLPEQTGAQTP